MAKKYYLGENDRKVLQKNINKVNKLTKGSPGVRRRRTSPGRKGGIGKHFQLIKGAVVVPEGEEVPDASSEFVWVDGIIEFEEHAKIPPDEHTATPDVIQVRVAIPLGITVPIEGDIIWAAYHKDILIIDVDDPDPDIHIHWYKLPSGGESAPPLRMFELLEQKDIGQFYVQVSWVDDAGNLVGGPLTLHDPIGSFHGRPAEYYVGNEYYYDETVRGNQGYALLTRDLAEEYPVADHWEMITCEGFARIVILEYYDPGSPVTPGWTLLSIDNSESWDHMRPIPDVPELVQEEEYYIPLFNSIGILPALTHGLKVLATLSNPNTTPPGYEVLAVVSGENVPPLRRFEVTNSKYTTTDSVFGKWLDHDGNMVGDDVVLYDPELLFACRAAGYITGEDGFRGEALLRTDLGAVPDAPRWEIVTMEGFARWITAVCDVDEYDELTFLYTGIYDPTHWYRKPPVEINDPVAWDATLNPLVEPIRGDVVLMKLYDPDTADSPIYVPVAVFDRAAIIQVRSTGGGDPAGFPVPKSGEVFPGRRGNIVETTPVDGDVLTDCWITDLAGSTNLPNKSFHLGRFVGLYDPDPGGAGTDERLRYAIRVSGRVVKGLTSAVVSAAASSFSINSLAAISGIAPPSPLTVLQAFPVGYASGQGVLAVELSSGEWINTPDAGKVRTSGADLLPEYLWDSIIDHGTFAELDHQVVYAQDVDAGGGNYRVKLFTDKSTGGGTTITGGAACTFLVDDSIAKATALAADAFEPTIKEFEFYILDVDTYVKSPDTRLFEWHDTEEGFDLPESGEKFLGIATLNEFEKWVIHTIFCLKKTYE